MIKISSVLSLFNWTNSANKETHLLFKPTGPLICSIRTLTIYWLSSVPHPPSHPPPHHSHPPARQARCRCPTAWRPRRNTRHNAGRRRVLPWSRRPTDPSSSCSHARTLHLAFADTPGSVCLWVARAKGLWICEATLLCCFFFQSSVKIDSCFYFFVGWFVYAYLFMPIEAAQLEVNLPIAPPPRGLRSLNSPAASIQIHLRWEWGRGSTASRQCSPRSGAIQPLGSSARPRRGVAAPVHALQGTLSLCYSLARNLVCVLVMELLLNLVGHFHRYNTRLSDLMTNSMCIYPPMPTVNTTFKSGIQ
jgi:hypothetical protein